VFKLLANISNIKSNSEDTLELPIRQGESCSDT